MSDQFDPYHQWLGIPASEQPAHHYRLLSIPAFEESPTVIQIAADRQTIHLRTFQSGKHSAESQRLLNEVSAARVCLLNAEKKTAYDQWLRQNLPPSRPADQPEEDSLDAGLAAILDARRTGASAMAAGSAKKKAKAKPAMFLPVAVLTVAAVALVAICWAISRDGLPDTGRLAQADPASSVKTPKDVPTAPPGPSNKAPITEPKKEAAPDYPKPPVVLKPPEPKVEEIKPPLIQNTTPTEDFAAETPEPDEQRAPVKKLNPPSADDQKRLGREVDEIYKPAEAKDQAAKAALARKLLETGRNNGANPPEQYVLLRRAGEVARDAGEAELMLDAVDAMAAAGFDIQPPQVKAQLLKQLTTQVASGGVSQFSTMGAACVQFAEEAAANGAVDEALEVLDAANKSLAAPKKRAQQANRAARTAMPRTRTPADKAAQEKKAAEAQGEFDAIEAAQAVLTDCIKGLQQVRREHKALLAAQEKLKTEPDNADACLAVGSWYCFHQGDWDEGLKLLAKGSDAPLKSLAVAELASEPSKAVDRVARGDVWWDLAEKADGTAKAGMRWRAARWYQEAIPDLPPGLGKSRVEKRLAQAAEEPLPVAEGRSNRTPPPLAVAPFDEKAAKQHQAKWAKYLGVPAVQTNSIGMKLALIPSGEFQMGSPKELVDEELRLHSGDSWYKGQLPGEGPQHRVRLTKPYWLGVTEVTQEEYQRVMGNNPSKFQGDAKRPVEQVSWNDAVEFCRRLSELPGEKAAKKRYALPTEAQWEYACRAGSSGPWCFSRQGTLLLGALEEKTLGEYCWFEANSGSQTHPVAQKRANAFGLYDVYGNVWQWCQDWYDVAYYTNSPVDDPTGPAGGSYRSCRGGRLQLAPRGCRSGFRSCSSPETRMYYTGFRISLVLPERSSERARPVGSLSGGSAPSGTRPPLAVAPFDEKAAKQHQTQWAKHLGAPMVQTNSIGMKLALIPPGEFQMGSPDSLSDASNNQKPQHRVRITKPYGLGVTEVTQEEYQRVMGKNPSSCQGDPKRPVEQVSWNDAVEFCRKLSELPGEKLAKRQYGLPTEAQWEYACRAGTTGRWCFSPQPDPSPSSPEVNTMAEYGWFNANSDRKPHAAGQKRANAFGLYDMHGNVWEWCTDWVDWGVDYYAKSPVDDPTGPAAGSDRSRRGGCNNNGTMECRSAFREHFRPGRSGGDIGFRISLVLPEKSIERARPVGNLSGGSAPSGTRPPLAVVPFDEKTAKQH